MRSRPTGHLTDFKSTFPLRRDGGIVFEECLLQSRRKMPE
jgi:hypothetical protein